MLSAIEAISHAHQYTIAALGVIGTFSAVVVSLYVAFMSRKATRTQLTARASISIIIHDMIDPKNPPHYIALNITNTGMMPLRIPFSFCHWRVPFRKGFLMMNPLDSYGDRWVPKKTYPVEIAPRASQTFFVSTPDVLSAEMKRVMSGDNAVTAWQLRNSKMLIVSDDGLIFRAKVSKDVRQELSRAVAAKSTSERS